MPLRATTAAAFVPGESAFGSQSSGRTEPRAALGADTAARAAVGDGDGDGDSDGDGDGDGDGHSSSIAWGVLVALLRALLGASSDDPQRASAAALAFCFRAAFWSDAFSSSASILLCRHSPPLILKNRASDARSMLQASGVILTICARISSSSGGGPDFQ